MLAGVLVAGIPAVLAPFTNQSDRCGGLHASRPGCPAARRRVQRRWIGG
jgi:hypothetical protein